MKNKKRTGSFYTPKIVAEFMVDYVFQKLKGNQRQNINILEPSVGNGIFVKSIFEHKYLSTNINKFLAIEKKKIELRKANLHAKTKNYKGINSDFLEFQNNNSELFDLVIGNPPYIKKVYLSDKQKNLCQNIHFSAKLSNSKTRNIWTAFLVRCIYFTNLDGILAFVLPSEFLQVNFAKELRTLILKEFERIEIFTFNELLFSDSKGQDTILLIAERKSANKGVFFCNINKLTDISKREFNLSENINIRESKWTHHHLSSDEVILLEKLKKQLKTINNYCSSKAGIVTAANDFFIVDIKTVQKYSLEKFTKKILQKGVFVNGSVVLTKNDFAELISMSKPTFLITLDKNSEIHLNSKINEYLQLGVDKNLKERYKITIREKWYEVPNIGSPPDGFFFKRCNVYPKLVKNDAKVLVTDSAYKISMNDNNKMEDLIFSFYNSLTLSFAELNGRYYGGGVLELTPNEFKNLPIPYLNINLKLFNTFVEEFKSKKSIKEICLRNDLILLK
ncbi:MAG TPA: type I restriction endonuclease subunit M, partial [Bacteroidetes bacterium]|nr:type I restriction endonuclease subunit M [Bacteroidota bacterium]